MRPGFDPWVGKIPWRKERLPTPVFWPREFHGLYGPWGGKESATTELLSLTHSHNLPWFMDLTFQVPMQYCCLQDQTLLPPPTYINNWALFWLRLHLFFLSGVISSLFFSSILGTYWPGEFIFQCPIILPFHTVHDVLKARILKWFIIPFSSGPHFVRTVHHDLSILVGTTWHGS